MAPAQTAFQILREVLTLHSTVTSLKDSIERVERKLDDFVGRLARLEAHHDSLRENLKSQILGDIKADLIATNIRLEYASEEIRRRLASDVAQASLTEGKAP